ncbi:sensor histidine kinase [Pontibacter actiniarum]|uniref:histidine kinase n=1 Tax=Pontibacter actiniarum TaxID=323450 RepID=A0A1X9YSC1_9BACT|nr:ATP-binding protein [Pontibacter actiniarum]ARS35757.1 two-component sensor histidine kinase [Pontibacter actiniarum]
MSDVPWIIGAGTALLLGLSIFITLMTLTYQQRRLQHRKELDHLTMAYQREILQARLEAQEQTLLAVSQELHDNLGQQLALIRLHMSTLDMTGTQPPGQKVQFCKEVLDQAVTDLRHLSRRLNSRHVDHQSLPDLLRDLLQSIQKTGVLTATFRLQGQEQNIPAEKKLLVFRMVQEALSNSIRHAAATSIRACLAYHSDKLLLQISDDGKGIKPSELSSRVGSSEGSGLFNMHYRAKLMGARLLIRRQEPRGTLVSIELPYYTPNTTSYDHNQSSPCG